MFVLKQTIKDKTVYINHFFRGTITTTEEQEEAKQFKTVEAAREYQNQSFLLLTWNIRPHESNTTKSSL